MAWQVKLNVGYASVILDSIGSPLLFKADRSSPFEIVAMKPSAES
jgi:hypothetical protein